MKRCAPRSLVRAFHFFQIRLLHDFYHKPSQALFWQSVVDRGQEKVIHVANNGLKTTHVMLSNYMNDGNTMPYSPMLCMYF